jgi:MFS family permease
MARSTWQKQNIISNALALPQVFLVGRLSDKVSPKILVPAVLCFQILIMTGYMLCQDPSGWYAYVLSAFQGGSGFMIIVAMQGYAVKRVPKMIRGIVMALVISLSGLGGIIYLQLSKMFFKTAPNMVFGVLGLFDVVILVFILVAIAMGKYGDPAPQEDTFGEGNSKKNED